MAYTIVPNWSISSELITKAAQDRGLEVEILDREKNVYSITDANGQSQLFKASATMSNNVVGSRIADFKDLTFTVINRYVPDCPMPKSITINDGDDIQELLTKEQLSYPLVVKPLDGSHAEGVIVNINDLQTLEKAVQSAYEYNDNDKAIIQSMISGDDYRVLVVGLKVVAVSKRVPAFVTGDGKNTIAQLIEIENQHPMRGDDHDKPLTKITLNQESERVLHEQQLDPDSVPDNNQAVYLKRTANLSTGGVAIDYTDKIHPSIRAVAEKVATSLSMAVLAIDFVTSDITLPLSETNGGLIEINDTPGLRMHHFPYEGKARDAAGEIIKYVFKLQ
jgi:cyanophycin synthetase